MRLPQLRRFKFSVASLETADQFQPNLTHTEVSLAFTCGMHSMLDTRRAALWMLLAEE